MARYSEQELDKIRNSVDLVSIIKAKGIKISEDFKATCPFHKDTKTSLTISENLFTCSSCKASGDVIFFIQKYDGISFRHAVELLRSKDSTMLNSKEKVKNSRIRKLSPPISQNADDQKLLNQTVEYYHRCLLENQNIQAYLKKREIFNMEAIKKFKLGYSDRSLGLRIPSKQKAEGKKIRSRLQEIGLYRKSGHEHFNGCLIIPITDENENIIEIYGRKIIDKLRKGTPFHLYLSKKPKAIWNSECLSIPTMLPNTQILSKWVIVTEALIDGLSFYCHGYRNVISGFSEELLKTLISHNIEDVYIAFDNDDTGNKASEKLAKQLHKKGIKSYRIKFPYNMDANSYLVSKSSTKHPNAGGLALRSAVIHAELMFGNIDKSKREKPIQEITPIYKEEKIYEKKGDDILFNFINRSYRIRGLQNNTSYEILKVQIRLSINDAVYIDSFDYYNARQRKSYIQFASEECKEDMAIIKRDIGRILLQLEELQEKNINQLLENEVETAIELTEEQKKQALKLLRNPNLLDVIVSDFQEIGLVGENTNALVAYLSATSRKTDDPLAIIIQSSSSAGKTSLMDAVLSFMPIEDVVKFTSMTGQSLFYMGETSLKNKILAISEEEGVEQAGYALKILQSEKEVKIASTGKDVTSGRLVVNEYKSEGPTSIFMTTTNDEIDEELQNRCLILTVNENREQTKKIHDLQRKSRTLTGLLKNETKQAILEVHNNAQRLLKPLMIVNPYAEKLTFLDARLRTRRDHIKYLNLINAITLIHQYQREIKTVKHLDNLLEYIEVDIKDIEVANCLASEIMGTSLDELSPQTRILLQSIHSLCQKLCKERDIEPCDLRLTRKEIRKYTGWADTRLRKHLQRLVSMEYLILSKAINSKIYMYELLYNGEGIEGEKFVLQLIDTEKLNAGNKQIISKEVGG